MDIGGEYFSQIVDNFFSREHAIRHEHSAPYNPQQNVVIEWKNQAFLDASRSILHPGGRHK